MLLDKIDPESIWRFMLRSNEIQDPFEANLPFSALKNSALLLRWVRGPLRNSSHPIGGSLRA
jgi:hypothetical protein